MKIIFSLFLFFLFCWQDVEARDCFTASSQKKIKPYLLPAKHPLKPHLDEIFSKDNVLKDLDSLVSAGFIPLHFQPTTHVIVARHPNLPGYLVKLYVETENRVQKEKDTWEWFLSRCQGAENVRKLIKKKKLKHFVVPDKWLYKVANREDEKNHPYILVVTDMDIVSLQESEAFWKNGVTKEQLNELYCILSHGYSSCYLPFNIPLTKNKKLACIDTEHPKRSLDYQKVQQFLSPAMGNYWNKITHKKKA